MARNRREPVSAQAVSAGRPELRSIAEFARHLKLSAWTVSRAINGHPEVKEKTRRRILAAMDELGFRPNPLARGLGGRRTGLIGVCFIGLGNPIVARKVYALQEFLRRQHLHSLLEVRLRDREQELRAIESFQRIHVDGVVLMYSELEAEAAAAALKDTPCVQVDPHHAQRIPSVALDRREAMRLLMEHLFRLEHQRFGLLGTGRTDVWRWPALIEIARARQLDPRKIYTSVDDMLHVESEIERGQLMAREVLKIPLARRPTALVSANDQMALGAIQVLREAGVAIPREMSVTGFDNLDIGRKLHPTLTTIDQNSAQLMARAGELLLQQIRPGANEIAPALAETVPPSLVIGESTGPAPIERST